MPRAQALVRGLTRKLRHRAASAVDTVFVVPETSRGWILDAICREIAARSAGTVHFHYGDGPLPAARAYFFSHYLLFLDATTDPAIRGALSVVWFTHPSYPPERARGVSHQLRRASMVASSCSLHARHLVESGLPSRKVVVAIPGADPERFPGHQRGSGAVGLCSAYYPRKAPEKVLEIVRALPHRNFRLMGRNWESSEIFTHLEAQPNFTYLEFDEDSYPAFYQDLDVFVSCSSLEGGPIPLLEAMMSNVVPVATRTGFAPDLITHAANGFLCEVDAPAHVFADLIETAFDSEADVRRTVEHLTWDAYATAIRAILDPSRQTVQKGPGGEEGDPFDGRLPR